MCKWAAHDGDFAREKLPGAYEAQQYNLKD
jgi:hypothetical protein